MVLPAPPLLGHATRGHLLCHLRAAAAPPRPPIVSTQHGVSQMDGAGRELMLVSVSAG